MEHKKLAVAICTDSRMLPAACCVLLWTWQHAHKNVTPFVVGVDLSASDLAAIRNFSLEKGCPIEHLAHVSLNAQNHDLQRFGQATIARLALDKVVPDSFDRVLFIDADVYIADNIMPLFQMNMSNQAMAAVTDISKHGPEYTKKRSKAIGMSGGADYFMAGMMLFDWPKTLSKHLLAKSRDVFAKGNNFKFPDMDALNIAVNGNFAKIPPRWNAEPFLWKIATPINIFHFSGREKPWNANAPFQYQKYRKAFRDTLAGTSWQNWVRCRSLFDLIAALNMSVKFHFKVKKKERRVVAFYSKFQLQDEQLS